MYPLSPPLLSDSFFAPGTPQAPQGSAGGGGGSTGSCPARPLPEARGGVLQEVSRANQSRLLPS